MLVAHPLRHEADMPWATCERRDSNKDARQRGAGPSDEDWAMISLGFVIAFIVPVAVLWLLQQ